MRNCSYCGAEMRPGDGNCLACGNRLFVLQPDVAAVMHGRYRILGIVGQGGMGMIYVAEDSKLGQRLVAVKEVKLSGVQSREERDRVLSAFEQEALLLANLSHPCLPSIYDHFNDNKHWYIVMQYIKGEALSRRLRVLPDGIVPVEDVLIIGIKLCEVLSYLHAQTPPVIFSDLKPSNIMLTPEGNLYLIDFGIARLFEVTLADDRIFASQGYSPPEQYQHAQLSPRADIYSLGATFHQMLSGQHPAKAKFHFAGLQLGKQPWAAELESLVMSMLKQDEEERPPNIIVVRQVLQRIIGQWTHEQGISPTFSLLHGGISVWGAPSSGATSPTPWKGIDLDNRNHRRGRVRKPSSPTPWKAADLDITLIRRPAIPGPSPSIWELPTIRLASSARSQTIGWASIPIVPAPSLPDSVTCRDIPLSLHSNIALEWSPNGSLLAVANVKEVHIYAWPPVESLSKNEPLVPLHSWDLEDLLPLSHRGFTRRVTLGIAWSPDASYLAITGNLVADMLFVLDIVREDLPIAYGMNKQPVLSWSPDGNNLVSADNNNALVVQDVKTEQGVSIKTYLRSVTALAWSPDSKYLASASGHGMIHVREAINGNEVCIYQGHLGNVHDVLWASDGKSILSCGDDRTVQIWDARTARKLRSIEAHSESVMRIASFDQDRFLASLSVNGVLCIWRTDTWALAEKLQTGMRGSAVAFHPTVALVAISEASRDIRLYDINLTQLQNSSQVNSIQYTNAKVVLLGDSGVGKSGLGLVLSRQNFIATESTHGRRVWTFDRGENKLDDGRKEIRETLLWDLAGQPGYRLVHQLHLNEVALALVVFDAHSETDPFAGISHWVRALRTAQRVRGNMGAMKLLLVLARVDRGGKRASQSRIDEMLQNFEFDGYFETSAKEGTHIAELSSAIEEAIDWDQLPKVTSTELLQHIREFLIQEKQANRILSTTDDLYRTFLRTLISLGNQGGTSGDFADFITGVRLLGSTGIIRQLNFGNLVLLQPELLDTYASTLVNTVRDEPDGLGSILEEDVYKAAFPIPKDERITDSELEKLLLIAMVKDLLFFEIALREQGEDGAYLVFPSESTRENPALPNPENASVVFAFEGPALNIYATLAVRLSHSGLFTKKELWKNAVAYHASVGGICGIWLQLIEDGKGEFTLFFEEQVSAETQFHFEEYVRVHLERKALSGSIEARRIHRCRCGFVAPGQLVRMRSERGYRWFRCPVCGQVVDMRDHQERLRSASPSLVSEMDRAADLQRTRATAQSTLQGKHETNDFDVFLCYNDNQADQAEVTAIAEQLKEEGLLPWFDVWEEQPGRPWQRLREQQIEQIKSAAVFVGAEGVGPWQQHEVDTLLREFVRRGCPVIPIILGNAPREPELPLFLQGMGWVDFRKRKPDPLEQFIWGITGKRSSI